MNRSGQSFRLLLCVLWLGLLTGCPATPPVQPTPTPGADAEALLVQAEERLRQGDFSAAAELFDRAAGLAPSPQRDELLVRAADAWLQAGQAPAAEASLAQARRTLLAPEQALLARLLQAELALKGNRFGEALGLLPGLPDGAAPMALRQRYLRAQAEALRLAGNLLESARSLSELDLLLVGDPPRRMDHQVQILRTLVLLTDTSLDLLRPNPPGLFGGWMDLARVLKDETPETLDARLALWRDTHPEHPALPGLTDRYRGILEPEARQFARVAVLLPASGRFAAAGQALRDGLLASYYALPPEQRPLLRWYDTSDPAQARPLLQQAVADGAQAVIGPLQKEALQQLIQGGELPVPVLALNRIPVDGATPAALFQFGLAPEDEAAQAADRMWQDGVRSALVLAPAGDWGERVLLGFRERWQALGGRPPRSQSYDPNGFDFSAPIRTLLDPAGGAPMPAPAAGAAGLAVGGEALLLAANVDKARQLWPQLQFFNIGERPVYTTSSAYSGRFDATKDLDLVGLRVPDMPWLLQPGSGAPVRPDGLPAGVASGALARLFAMGVDSFRLLGTMEQLRDLPGTSLAGATGNLYLDQHNQVRRQLLWARIGARGAEVIGFGPPPVDGLGR
jgi:outer membrane PBP1 activator LpoA protein